jgi:hypothetical protein
VQATMRRTVLDLLLEAIWGKGSEDSVTRCMLRTTWCGWCISPTTVFLIKIELHHSYLSSYCLELFRKYSENIWY